MQCKTCHREFTPTNLNQKYCHFACKPRPHKCGITYICVRCQEPFTARREAKRKYCSLTCAYIDRQRLALLEFWTHVDIRGPDECWPWMGDIDKKGYGRVGIGSLTQCGRGAHQVAYVITHNMEPIPKGIAVCHSCDNPPCCNDSHLFLGTQQDNLDDCKSKGRGPRGERNGMSKITAEDAMEIIRLKRNGRSSIAISLHYHISVGSVNRIASGDRWGHLQ